MTYIPSKFLQADYNSRCKQDKINLNCGFFLVITNAIFTQNGETVFLALRALASHSRPSTMPSPVTAQVAWRDIFDLSNFHLEDRCLSYILYFEKYLSPV